MISPKSFITYAQYNEDVILAALFFDEKKGFYVDVGANYPVIDSVTKHFYDKGWRGINIEPIQSLAEQLRIDRPKDINLEIGVGARSQTIKLREYTDKPGHSTFDVAQKFEHKDIKHVDYPVEIHTLKDVFAEHQVKKISFLKIDVEGYEYDVLAGMDWKVRPEVICIEANKLVKDWRPILVKERYHLFIQDGLNNFYVAEESWHRTENFVEHAVELDYHALKQHQAEAWSQDIDEIKNLNQKIKNLENLSKSIDSRLYATQKERDEFARLSLTGRSLGQRVIRAGYGLTIDWFRYWRSKKRQ